MIVKVGGFYRLSKLGTLFKVTQINNEQKKQRVRLKRIDDGPLTGRRPWSGYVLTSTFLDAFVKPETYKSGCCNLLSPNDRKGRNGWGRYIGMGSPEKAISWLRERLRRFG